MEEEFPTCGLIPMTEENALPELMLCCGVLELLLPIEVMELLPTELTMDPEESHDVAGCC
jgi:hypothetical protein